MSKRLQVLVPDDEMAAIKRQAESKNLTVAEYVREALPEVAARRPTKSAAVKRELVRTAAKLSLPTADIEKMNREIERGYLE